MHPRNIFLDEYFKNKLHEDGTIDTDIRIKRASFINTCMNLNKELCFVKPNQQVKLLYNYNSHFSGSSSWNFNSVAFQQLTSSWNVNLRAIYDLDFGTHNYLMEGLTNGRHAKQNNYWEKVLWAEASPLDSLEYFHPSFMSLHKPHPIWSTAGSSPSKVAMATIQAQMLSGRYRTQLLCSHWTPGSNKCCQLSPSCSTYCTFCLSVNNLKKPVVN